MGNQFAEPDGEALLFGIVEMSLITEKDDLVLEQHLVDGTNGLVRKIARQLEVPDLGADSRRALDDVRARNDVIDNCRVAHDRVLIIAIPKAKLRRTPVARATAEISEIISGCRPTRP